MTRGSLTGVKKPLLLVVPNLTQGGIQRICVQMARLLAADFRVTVAVFSLEGAIYDLDGLDVRDLNIPSASGKAVKICNAFRRAGKLKQLKKKLGIQVAYSLGSTANLANALSGGPGRVWCGIHSFLDLEPGGFLPFLLRHADRVLCCSRALASRICAEYRCGKVATLYNPYDCEEIRALARKAAGDMPDWTGKTVILTMGRADDVKGYWHLIKSFSLVYRACPQSRLVFVGAGDFGEYRQLARDCGVEKAVFFAGVQKNPFPWVDACDIYALSSRNEGFPNAMVEAMLLGKPPVAANCPTGPAEILSDRFEELESLSEAITFEAGVLTPCMPYDKNLHADQICREEKIFARSLLLLVRDEALRKRLGQGAAQRAARFSAQACREAFCCMAAEDCP